MIVDGTGNGCQYSKEETNVWPDPRNARGIVLTGTLTRARRLVAYCVAVAALAAGSSVPWSTNRVALFWPAELPGETCDGGIVQICAVMPSGARGRPTPTATNVHL